MAPWWWFYVNRNMLEPFYYFNYFNNLRILQFVCISWTIKCLMREGFWQNGYSAKMTIHSASLLCQFWKYFNTSNLQRELDIFVPNISHYTLICTLFGLFHFWTLQRTAFCKAVLLRHDKQNFFLSPICEGYAPFVCLFLPVCLPLTWTGKDKTQTNRKSSSVELILFPDRHEVIGNLNDLCKRNFRSSGMLRSVYW